MNSLFARAVRVLIALAGLGLAALLIAQQRVFRGWEVEAQGWLIRTIAQTPATVTRERAIVWVGEAQAMRGFLITFECSAAAIVAGFLAVSAVLIVFYRQPLRVVVAFATATAIVLACNLLRISLVIGAAMSSGHEAFEWAHTYLGTFITVTGVLLATVAYIAVLARGRAVRRRRNPSVRSATAAMP